MRRGPQGGYDFSRKRDYRRKVWATFRDRLKQQRLSVAESHALLMPSLEGDEIDVALNVGFREYNLHVVDQEPAIVATLKRRYPRINTYGVSASRAMERLAKNGIRLRCANFDFCGQVSKALAHELYTISLFGNLSGDLCPSGFKVTGEHGVFDDSAFVAVSLLRGREPKTWTTAVVADDISSESLQSLLRTSHSRIDQGFAGLFPDKCKAVIHGATSFIRHLLPFTERDRHRLLMILKMLTLEISEINIKPYGELLRAEHYLSTSGQTMLWSIWNLQSIESAKRQQMAADAVRASLGLIPRGFADLSY